MGPARANPKGQDKYGRTALHLASLYFRLKEGHVVAKELLDRGADMEAKDGRGNTPLHAAAANYHLSVLTELLDRGANLEARDSEGRTALHKAAQWNEIRRFNVIQSDCIRKQNIQIV